MKRTAHKPVLLTVSGVIDAARAADSIAGRKPRADYFELAAALDAEIIDYAQARHENGRLGQLLEWLGGPDLLLAWACFQRREDYQLIVTDGEQVGIPLAALLSLSPRARRVRHAMIAHVLTVRKKMLFFDLLRVQRGIDRFLVYATRQKQFIEQRWGIAPAHVLFTPFMVDDEFFAAEREAAQTRRMICAVGLERRDYATLLQAVAGLQAEVIIAAASPWSKRRSSTSGQVLPPNVRVQRYSQLELRRLYAESRFLVMPLEPVDFQAGVTAILEAMAMGKAVICSRTAGQTDILIEGEHGLYVPPGDAAALRQAISYLLAHPQEAQRMGRNGRQRVEQLCALDRYAARISEWLGELYAAAPDATRAQPTEVS